MAKTQCRRVARSDLERGVRTAVDILHEIEDATAGLNPGQNVGHRSSAGRAGRPRIMSVAFSPIIKLAAFVLAEGMVGITDASATRRRSTPCTRSFASTTLFDFAAGPMLQVPTG